MVVNTYSAMDVTPNLRFILEEKEYYRVVRQISGSGQNSDREQGPCTWAHRVANNARSFLYTQASAFQSPGLFAKRGPKHGSSNFI
jgi:hypothetical protein